MLPLTRSRSERPACILGIHFNHNIGCSFNCSRPYAPLRRRSHYLILPVKAFSPTIAAKLATFWLRELSVANGRISCNQSTFGRCLGALDEAAPAGDLPGSFLPSYTSKAAESLSLKGHTKRHIIAIGDPNV